MDTVKQFKRIEARRNVTSGVQAWVEPVIIPTYPAMDADLNPMFLENRVYQGSSGRVYPLPFVDRVSAEKVDKVYQAIHIENEFLYVMILPEIGGRIHIAVDKTNDYDFFYRQNVIKPALVGLCGPWISGGVEFNWPQHHRPSTYMPCEHFIEQHDDGSVTVWLSEHEPMDRMKGMHGVHISPDSSCLELRGQIYNRTPMTRTFLWWANVAAEVGDHYQSFFPSDVHQIADHAKRATSDFPECTGFYYGVDYRPATGLDWYKNIPVPTSYMVTHSEFDFFGGYDHGKQAGFVHVADRHIAPGKKQWTWGNHAFGHAWDRNLTDESGPYVELMAGVYTDNQPDFSFLAPYEARTFTQTWYPIRGIGPASNVTTDAALAVKIEGQSVTIGVSPSRVIRDATMEVETEGVLRKVKFDAAPGQPFTCTLPLPSDIQPHDVYVNVVDSNGHSLVHFRPLAPDTNYQCETATEPPAPEEIETLEELYLTGLHLHQYRHATRKPELYWQEALKRDPLDSRCNVALANWYLARGEYATAETHARNAIARLTARNPNPRDGEAHYVLGLALERQGRDDDAKTAFAKATWSYAWAYAAHFRIGCIDARAKRYPKASERWERCLEGLARHLGARLLLSALARTQGQTEEAFKAADAILAQDPLDHGALRETHDGRYLEAMRDDPQNFLDLAIDYADAGFFYDAIQVLLVDARQAAVRPYPMLHYAAAMYLDQLGRHQEAQIQLEIAAKVSPDYCFPARLEDIDFLLHAKRNNPADANAPYYLGNLFYDRRRYEEAILEWEQATQLNPGFSIPWRNLGIAYFNVQGDPAKARYAYDQATQANPDDARVLYERDQLRKSVGDSPTDRLKDLEAKPQLVELRDDLSLQICALYNQTGTPTKALEILTTRNFSPWEGGEGVALGEWTRTHLQLGRTALQAGKNEEALAHFQAAEQPPLNLGEARHLLANASDVWYWLGEALSKLGHTEEAKRWWTKAAEFKGDFQEMAVQVYSELTYFQALALRRLGKEDEARGLLLGLRQYAEALEKTPAKIDYFATSLPTMLLFNDDLQLRQTVRARLVLAQTYVGLGEPEPGKVLLKEVLAHDPNHAIAADLARELGRLH